MKTSLIFLMIFWGFCSILGQTITNVGLDKYHLKLGENFNVSIKTSGDFQSGNIFRVEISSKDGDFVNATIIGSIPSIGDVVIPCRVPDSLSVSENYRLRVSATLPNYVSSPITQKIIIYRGFSFYVSSIGVDTNEGSINSPFRTIQHGLNLAWYFDTIFVLPGTYFENLSLRGIPLSLIGLKGLDSTIIDGGNNGIPVISIENISEGHLLIDGFTVQNGRSYEVEQGGGIVLRNSTAAMTLSNLKFQNNKASSYGGGLYCYSSGPISIKNCIFENNDARYFGAGIYAHFSPINIENSIIGNNKSGGIMAYRSNLTLKNCLIYKNNFHEVMIVSDLGERLTPTVINSTIFAQPSFYAYYLEGRFFAQIYNSIFYGQDSTIYVSGDAYDTLDLDYNIVYNYPKGFVSKLASIKYGNNNLSDDPLFINSTSNNFDLDTCSPAIGSASKLLAPPVDIFGHPRPISADLDEYPDRGAIESPRSQRSNIAYITKVSKNLFCESEKFYVDYQIGGCSFYQGNEFFIEISNENGTFQPSTTIGSIRSSNSGRIECQIPLNLTPGSYKLRIRATRLPYRSEPFQELIQVFGTPSAEIYGETKVCSKREYFYWTDSSNNPINKWTILNGFSYNLLTENLIKVVWYDSSTGKISLNQTNPAGCSGFSSKDVTILSTPDKPTIQFSQGGFLVSNYPSWNQWYLNGNLIPGANNRTYQPTKNGYYSVKIIPPYGCPSDFSDSIYIDVSRVDEDSTSGVIINYLDDLEKVRIIFRGNIDLVQLTMYDIFGKRINNVPVNIYNNYLEIQTKFLVNNGIYFLWVSGINENYFIKLLISK